MAYIGLLPEAPSFGQRLSRGLGGGIGAGVSSGIEKSIDFSQKMALEKQKAHSLVQQTKQLEKVKMMETGLGTIERMRDLLSSAGGWTSDPIKKIQSLVPGEVQKNRAELEALGRSLIPLVAAGVPIRNQKEFEEYRKIITDPNSSPSEFEGALNGIQNILERSIESPSDEMVSKKTEPMKVKSSGQMVKMKTPDGKIVRVPKDRVNEAIEAGGEVVR